MLRMRPQLISALLAHANGEIAKHKANVEIYLEHPVGIGEHSDITEAIGLELDKISRYHDQVEVLNKYFKWPITLNQITYVMTNGLTTK